MAVIVNTIEGKDLKTCISDILQGVIATNQDGGVACPNEKISWDTGFELNGTQLGGGIAFVCYQKGTDEKPGMATVCVDTPTTVGVGANTNIIIELISTYIDDPKEICDDTNLEQGLNIARVRNVTNAQLATIPYHIVLYSVDGSGNVTKQFSYMGASDELNAKNNSCCYTAGEAINAGMVVFIDPIDGKAYRSNRTNVTPNGTTRNNFSGFATSGAAIDTEVCVQSSGIFRGNAAFTATAHGPGFPLYIHSGTFGLATAATAGAATCSPIGFELCDGDVLINSSAYEFYKTQRLQRIKDIEDIIDADPCYMTALENIDVGDAVASNGLGGIVKADANGGGFDANFIGFAVNTGATGSLIEVQTSGVFINPDGAQGPNGSVAYLSATAGNVSISPSSAGAIPIGCFVCDDGIEIDKSYVLQQTAIPNKCDMIDYSRNGGNNVTENTSFLVNLPHDLGVIPSCIEFKSQSRFDGSGSANGLDRNIGDRMPYEGQRCNGVQRTCRRCFDNSFNDADYLTIQNDWIFDNLNCFDEADRENDANLRVRVVSVTSSNIQIEVDYLGRNTGVGNNWNMGFDTFIKLTA